ncbi:MAG: hypothetical protein Q8R20_00925 [Nanoarchaeota archaeon]|nr:hypothetical protein [Nanoarchaeota archaeon]
MNRTYALRALLSFQPRIAVRDKLQLESSIEPFLGVWIPVFTGMTPIA